MLNRQSLIRLLQLLSAHLPISQLYQVNVLNAFLPARNVKTYKRPVKAVHKAFDSVLLRNNANNVVWAK